MVYQKEFLLMLLDFQNLNNILKKLPFI